MRTTQAALVGLLAGIVAIPAYFLGAMVVDFFLGYLVTLKVGAGELGIEDKLGLLGVFQGGSLFRQIFATLFFAPLALVFSTLGSVLSLQLFHKNRIERG